MNQVPGESLSKVGRLLKTNTYSKIAEIFLLFLFVLAFIRIVLPQAGDNLILKQAFLWLANVLMLIYIWVGLHLRGEGWKDFGLSINKISGKVALKVFLLSLLVFGLSMVGFLFGSVIMANITGIPESADMSGYDYLKDNLGMLFLTLIGVYMVSSFGEEVIYRAFLITRIAELRIIKKFNIPTAVVLSAIVFGLIHFGWGPMGIVQTAFMGLVLGICFIKLKRRLWILILAHAYMDTILMIQLYLASN